MPADSPAPAAPLTGRPGCAEADAWDAAERPRAARAPASGMRPVRHRSDRGIAIRTPRDHRPAPPERPGDKRPAQRRNARQRRVPVPAETRGWRNPRRPPPPPGRAKPASSRCCRARASAERAARLRRQPTAGLSPLCAGKDELWRVRLFFVGGPGGPGGLRATWKELAFLSRTGGVAVDRSGALLDCRAVTHPLGEGVRTPRNERVESKKTEVAEHTHDRPAPLRP